MPIRIFQHADGPIRLDEAAAAPAPEVLDGHEWGEVIAKNAEAWVFGKGRLAETPICQSFV